jgi:hypothetical protein
MDRVRVLYGYEIVNGWVWIEVQDKDGRIGWLPQYVTMLITETPTRTPKGTFPSPSTPTPEITSTEEALTQTFTPSPNP